MENDRTGPGRGRPRHLSVVRPGTTRPRPTREQLQLRVRLLAAAIGELGEDLAELDTGAE